MMKILLIALLLVCHASCRPSDPVTREFGTQPNNPNVKIFSTYPTLKPVVRQDNPNELEKADHEKLEKDENETEFKGEELIKAENDEMELKANATEIKTSEEESMLETPSPVAHEVVETKTKDDAETANKTDSMPKDIASQLAEDEPTSDLTDAEQAVVESSSDGTVPEDLSPAIDLTPESEVEVEDDTVVTDPNPPIFDEPIFPFSEPELISPIAVEAPVDVLPPLFEDELEEDYNYGLPEFEDDETLFGLGDQAPYSGVLLPVLVPVEEVPVIDTQDENVFAVTEETTLSPITNEESLDYNKNVPAESFPDQVGSIQPEVEMSQDVLEPMGSLTDESVILEPVVETDETAPLSETEESVNVATEMTETTESSVDMDPMEGDIGASVPMGDNIPPIVEAELDQLPDDTQVENSTEKNNASELSDTPQEKYSLRILKADQDEEATEEEVVTEYPTEEPIQMAGFMSEELKSSPSPMPETTLPSTTELIFLLNFTDNKDVSKQEPSSTTAESTAGIEPRETETVEPIDNLEGIHNLEPNTEKTIQSTTESIPTIHPIELTNEEDGTNDLTLNETI